MGKSQSARNLEAAVPIEGALRHDTVLAEVVSASGSGRHVVAFEGREHACEGATVPVTTDDVGRTATVMFLGGDPGRPIVTGLVQGTPSARGQAAPVHPARQELDARELVLSADEQITLRCGKSCIILTRDGKIVIRGEHLLSRATSVNRIRGGTILLN